MLQQREYARLAMHTLTCMNAIGCLGLRSNMCEWGPRRDYIEHSALELLKVYCKSSVSLLIDFTSLAFLDAIASASEPLNIGIIPFYTCC